MAPQHTETLSNQFYFIIIPCIYLWELIQIVLFVNINILSVWDAVINEHTLKQSTVSVWLAPTPSAILRNSLLGSLVLLWVWYSLFLTCKSSVVND